MIWRQDTVSGHVAPTVAIQIGARNVCKHRHIAICNTVGNYAGAVASVGNAAVAVVACHVARHAIADNAVRIASAALAHAIAETSAVAQAIAKAHATAKAIATWRVV